MISVEDLGCNCMDLIGTQFIKWSMEGVVAKTQSSVLEEAIGTIKS